MQGKGLFGALLFGFRWKFADRGASEVKTGTSVSAETKRMFTSTQTFGREDKDIRVRNKRCSGDTLVPAGDKRFVDMCS